MRPRLLGQAVDDLDAGEVALVDGAVEGLSRESLLVDRAVRVAVEEAAPAILELTDALLRDGHERPGEVLVVQPGAAMDGVHEVALGGILRREGHIVAALHHAGAAGFAEQALHRDGDAEIGGGGFRVQRAEQPGAAGAEDEDVGGGAGDLGHGRGALARPARAVGHAATAILRGLGGRRQRLRIGRLVGDEDAHEHGDGDDGDDEHLSLAPWRRSRNR
jgi:hypothetical protein